LVEDEVLGIFNGVIKNLAKKKYIKDKTFILDTSPLEEEGRMRGLRPKSTKFSNPDFTPLLMVTFQGEHNSIAFRADF